MADFFGLSPERASERRSESSTDVADCEQPTRTLTETALQAVPARFILSRLTVRA